MDFFTIMIILITLVVFVFIVLIAFVMKKSKDVKNDAFLEDERNKMLQNVLKKRKKLIPHTSDFYLQITDAMTFQSTAAVTNTKISGLLYNTQRKSIAAFERIERGASTKGQLVAITKKHTFRYEFQQLEITFFCDDELVGSLDKTGILYDTDKKAIGQYKRIQDTNAVILHNKTIATLQKAAVYDNLDAVSEVSKVFEEFNYGTPLLSVDESLTPEAKKWLTALAIFEITFYGNTLVA
ncbi:MAG: hypothetical protein AAF617_09605 [Bacteroidota bacterium]